MTLTFVDGGPGPRLHALVIGIGGYAHLRGGTGHTLRDPLRYGNLGQLTSPPRSAIAVANALLAGAVDWAVPVGSVDLLVSPAPSDPDPAGDGRAYEPATREAIRVAFRTWWQRCDARENIAFFYVAGHGIEGRHQIVLASDFGVDPDEPWTEAFDVDETREALRANKAECQLYFVDACREVTTSNVETPNAAVPPLRSARMRERDNCIYDLTIKATSRTRKAYGAALGASYFTEALVHGLRGGAGIKADGQWWVTTGKLAERFYLLMELAGADTDAQRPVPIATRTRRLVRLGAAPAARLTVSCHPTEATALADLAWWQGAGARQTRGAASRDPWTVEVAPGLYYVAAGFPGREYPDTEQDVIVEPPMTSERVVVG